MPLLPHASSWCGTYLSTGTTLQCLHGLVLNYLSTGTILRCLHLQTEGTYSYHSALKSLKFLKSYLKQGTFKQCYSGPYFFTTRLLILGTAILKVSTVGGRGGTPYLVNLSDPPRWSMVPVTWALCHVTTTHTSCLATCKVSQPVLSPANNQQRVLCVWQNSRNVRL
jgi:hypothetical protein